MNDEEIKVSLEKAENKQEVKPEGDPKSPETAVEEEPKTLEGEVKKDMPEVVEGVNIVKNEGEKYMHDLKNHGANDENLREFIENQEIIERESNMAKKRWEGDIEAIQGDIPNAEDKIEWRKNHCSACEAEIPEGAKFCIICGVKLVKEEDVEQDVKKEAIKEMSVKEIENLFEEISKEANALKVSTDSIAAKREKLDELLQRQRECVNNKQIALRDEVKNWREAGNFVYEAKEAVEKDREEFNKAYSDVLVGRNAFDSAVKRLCEKNELSEDEIKKEKAYKELKAYNDLSENNWDKFQAKRVGDSEKTDKLEDEALELKLGLIKMKNSDLAARLERDLKKMKETVKKSEEKEEKDSSGKPLGSSFVKLRKLEIEDAFDKETSGSYRWEIALARQRDDKEKVKKLIANKKYRKDNPEFFERMRKAKQNMEMLKFSGKEKEEDFKNEGKKLKRFEDKLEEIINQMTKE